MVKNKKSLAKQFIVGIVAVVVLIVVDQFTKYWAVNALMDKPPIIWIKGVFELLYLENRGAAFGILEGQRWIFLISVVVVLGVIGAYYGKIPDTKKYVPLRMVCIAICAGAIGNMLDRVINGYVVDFFYFSLIDFPVFNVADIYVTVSVFVLILLIFFYYKEEDFAFLSLKKKSDDSEEQDGAN